MQTQSVDAIELLSGTSLAAGMTAEQVAVLARCGKQEIYGDGEALVTKEDTQFDLLVVLEGKCEIRTPMNDVLSRLGDDCLIGEVSFLDQKMRSANAIAVGECNVVRFPASLLNDLEGSRPDIVAKLLKNIGTVLCQKLRSTTRFAEASFV
jgi:CRP-like cAMP-binding protein